MIFLNVLSVIKCINVLSVIKCINVFFVTLVYFVFCHAVRLFVRALVRSFVRLFVRALVRSCACSFVRSAINNSHHNTALYNNAWLIRNLHTFLKNRLTNWINRRILYSMTWWIELVAGVWLLRPPKWTGALAPRSLYIYSTIHIINTKNRK